MSWVPFELKVVGVVDGVWICKWTDRMCSFNLDLLGQIKKHKEQLMDLFIFGRTDDDDEGCRDDAIFIPVQKLLL